MQQVVEVLNNGQASSEYFSVRQVVREFWLQTWIKCQRKSHEIEKIPWHLYYPNLKLIFQGT